MDLRRPAFGRIAEVVGAGVMKIAGLVWVIVVCALPQLNHLNGL
jgi:hypothetical protein